MLGSAIGKGDGDAATFTKKEKERRFDEQYFKVLVQASLGTTIMPGIGTAIGAGVGAVVGVISGLFKSKKMKEARTLTGEQDRMFASAASAKKSRLAGEDSISIK
jgi:hypothetical protein